MQDRLAAGSYMRCTELIGPAGRAVFCGTINQGAIQWPGPLQSSGCATVNLQRHAMCVSIGSWLLAWLGGEGLRNFTDCP